MKVCKWNGDTYEYLRFRIINDYKKLEVIDLDISNIKKRPVKFNYTFNNIRNIRNAKNVYSSDLNKFLVISSDNYENQLLFNINKYMQNDNSNTIKYYFGKVLSNIRQF